jgi:hypothetical protein
MDRMHDNVSHVTQATPARKPSKAERRLQRTLDAIKARVDRAVAEWDSYIQDHWREFPRTDVDTLPQTVEGSK